MNIIVSILIPVHNRLELTKECLNNLGFLNDNAFNQIHFNIIVIDDGSSDGTSPWIKDNYPEIHILHGDGSMWWSGGTNVGAKYAFENLNADYVLLWNNDISVQNDYFVNLVHHIEENHGNKIIIGSKIKDKEKTHLVWSYGGYFNPRTGNKGMYGYKKIDNEEYNKTISVDWLTGMGTTVPKQVVYDIGFWDDKNFPQYHGDSDFTYRAKIAGCEVFVYPDLVIYNYTKSSGIKHNNTFIGLINLLSSTRSKANFKKNFLFYKRYATSPFAYFTFFNDYVRLIGGFFKWKFIYLLGIQKKNKND